MRNEIKSFLFLMALSSVCHAGTGQSAGYILTRTPSARVAALADSFGSVDDDVAGVKYNPGCLGTISKSQLSLMFNKDFAEDTFMNFTGGFILGAGHGAFAFSADSYDAGILEFYDSAGNKKRVSAEQDKVFGISYGNVLRLAGAPVYSGITLKYLSSTLVEYKTATAYALDAGFLYSFYNLPFAIGVSAQNVGTKIKYINSADPLPSSARVSLRYRVNNFFIIGDAGYLLYDKMLERSAGVEYALKGALALRGGYKFNSDTGGLSYGLGLKLKDIEINYASVLNDNFNNIHNISVNIFFSRPKAKKKAAKEANAEKINYEKEVKKINAEIYEEENAEPAISEETRDKIEPAVKIGADEGTYGSDKGTGTIVDAQNKIEPAREIISGTGTINGINAGTDTIKENGPENQQDIEAVPSNYINIKVSTRQGRPLSNIISTISQNGREIDKGLTDDTGECSFEGLSPGYYTIKVWKPGYSSSQKEVELTPDKPLKIDFFLHRR